MFRLAECATPTTYILKVAWAITTLICSGTNLPLLSRKSVKGSPTLPSAMVILNWRAVCGECRACKKGELQYCFATHNAEQKMTLEDGTELEAALGIGSFAEKTLVAAGQCTKIDAELQDDQDAAVGLLGCRSEERRVGKEGRW